MQAVCQQPRKFQLRQRYLRFMRFKRTQVLRFMVQGVGFREFRVKV